MEKLSVGDLQKKIAEIDITTREMFKEQRELQKTLDEILDKGFLESKILSGVAFELTPGGNLSLYDRGVEELLCEYFDMGNIHDSRWLKLEDKSDLCVISIDEGDINIRFSSSANKLQTFIDLTGIRVELCSIEKEVEKNKQEYLDSKETLRLMKENLNENS